MTTRMTLALLGAAASLLAAPAAAQLLGGGLGGLGNSIGGAVGGLGSSLSGLGNSVDRLSGLGNATGNGTAQRRSLVGGAFDRIEHLASSVADTSDSLLDLRKLRLSLLIDAHRAELDRDGAGNPVRRDRLVAVDPDPASLAAAARAGFTELGDEREETLGLWLVSFGVPGRMNPRKALETDRKSTRLNSSHLRLSRMPSSA